MSVSFSPGKQILTEDKVVLNVLLNCEETKSSETKQIHFKSLPTTPLEIKKKIEEDFSIPSCVQTLHYQSMILKDSDQLQHLHFRSGDTFTVDYPIEADCKMTQNVLKWLKQLYDLLKSIEECISFPDEEHDFLLSSNFQEIRSLMMEGVSNNTIEDLSYTLFAPWTDKKNLMNKFYFHQEGGLDVLMKVYDILVSEEWGNFGINEELHIFLERMCSRAVCNYAQTFPLRRQIVQLGGLERCTTTLLRRKLQGDEHSSGSFVYDTLRKALYALSNLSELPECRVPIAMRTDAIDQTLAMALHPAYDCKVAIVSVTTILCLAQSPESHVFITRKEVVENMLKACEQKEKIVSEQSLQPRQRKKEDPMIVNALKCYTGVVLAQIGLGSPYLLFDSFPLHLLNQILNIMSDVLEAATPVEIRMFEEKAELVWGTFLPYLQYLYKPSTTKNSIRDIKSNLHISWCNVLLHFLESTLQREIHLEILLKEGLLDYTVCLPAVLPGECQPRARSLVNELGKHRQLQPPSLCTLAKAHIAKTFCGLQPVIEMNSIGEFLHKYFCCF